MGRCHLKRGSGIVQRSAASPIVNRTMETESPVIQQTESNLNFHIIVPTIYNSLSTIFTSEEDLAPSPNACAPQSNPPTVTKENAPCFDSSLDSCRGSNIIALKRKSSENGLCQEEKRKNTVWQACNGVSINDKKFKELVSQQTPSEDTSDPNGSFCIVENGNAVDEDDTPIAADIDNESSTIDLTCPQLNDVDMIDSSDDEFTPSTPRFDRFRAEAPPPQRKVPIYDRLAPLNRGEGSLDSLLEASNRYGSTRDTENPLNSYARFRSHKRENDFNDQNQTKRHQISVPASPRPERTYETSSLIQKEFSNANNDVIVGTNDTVVQNNLTTCCRLPFNGHREDNEHYRLCNIILAGVVLRREHTNWLSDIPSHAGVMGAVNLIIGPSCKQLMLSGKCSDEHCTSKIDLNFSIPIISFNRVFYVFTKWFLQNAQQPNLKVMLLLLSRAPKHHHKLLMIVLSFSKMIVKLSNRIYRQALVTKLKEIMVNVLGYKPWEAVRVLLIFTVTPETEPSEILDLLSSLDVTLKNSKNRTLKNRLYESVSCLWHINERFVCPADLLFEVFKECLVQMPVELKMTKDRMVADLLKLPRKSLRKEFLVIDKFLDKYYPQNSEVAHSVRTSILWNSDVTKSLHVCRSYETSRVKGTGPVNPQWDFWDIREAQMEGFDMVMKNSQKNKPHEEIDFHRAPMDLSREIFEVDVSRHDLIKIATNRNTLCYHGYLPSNKPINFEILVDLLISGSHSQVAKIISSCTDFKSFEECFKTLERKFEFGDSTAAFPILKLLLGSLKDKPSVESSFICMLNSLVVKFYKNSDYKSALQFLKFFRSAGVKHMEHVPEHTDLQTFAVICSDINFKCGLYKEAIQILQYEDCLHYLCDPNAKSEQYALLEKLVKSMFKRFLKERHASHATEIFRVIFTKQKSLDYPLDIGKYFEGVIFLSFVRDLKKNACSAGTGAMLYTTVERICGNSEPFHTITYRSLLVELYRARSPENIIRRVFRICLKRRIYPDFSKGQISPLVLNSHLAKEEISIYLEYFFTHLIARNDLDRVKTRPFVVRFLESPCPDVNIFPVPNDIMKTSRSVPDALERLKSALNEMSHTLDADYSLDSVTLSVQDMETLIRLFSR